MTNRRTASDLRAEIATARARIDCSDMDPVAKLLAHGLINAHIGLAREVTKMLNASKETTKTGREQ